MKLAFTAATLVVVSACSEDAGHHVVGFDASVPPAPTKDAGHQVPKRDAAPPPAPTHTPATTPPDAATVTRDSGVPVITPPMCSGDLPVMTARDSLTFTEVAPDFDCYGRDGTDGGTDRDSGVDSGVDSGTVARKVSFDTVLHTLGAGVTVDFFYGSSTLGTPFATQVLDANGAVTISLPRREAVLSTRFHALGQASQPASIVEARDYGLRLSSDSPSLEGYVLVSASRDLAVREALGGIGSENPSKALLVADVRDCAGRPVNGAQVELFDGATNQLVNAGAMPDDPHISYSYFALPTPACTFTTDQQELATWMMVNAPVNVTGGVETHSYRLRVTGRRQANAAPVTIVEREVELFAGAISYVRP